MSSPSSAPVALSAVGVSPVASYSRPSPRPALFPAEWIDGTSGSSLSRSTPEDDTLGTNPSPTTTSTRKRSSPRNATNLPSSPRVLAQDRPPASAVEATNSAHSPAPPALAKRQKGPSPAVKELPKSYQHCPTSDLVVLIADLLGELVGLNDRIPLSGAGLTRFHSRAPPTISILDYLNRLAVHATLQPSILLSMVYYIDLLSTHYPPFVVSSLTVHRFLITAATVASKGLCDSFLTNTYYAKVGGVSLIELNMLELEFLVRVAWRIVPKAEALEEYYSSLVARLSGRYRIEDDEGG